MLKMVLTTTVALYAGFVIWGQPEDGPASTSPVTSSATVVTASDANFDKPVILSDSGDNAVVTRAAVTETVVPDAAEIAASAPVPGDVEPRLIGEPVVVSLVRPTTAAPEATAPAETTEAPDVDGLLRVTGSRVNLRFGPSTADSIVGSLSEGMLAEPVGSEIDGWIEIRAVDSGLTGYMASRFLDPA